MRNLKWSSAEKAIARKAFDRALNQDLDAVIDREYDYRYSVLLTVFAGLIRKGRLREEDLQGLAEDKLGHIRQMATL